MEKMVHVDLLAEMDQKELRVKMDKEEKEGGKVHLAQLDFLDQMGVLDLVEIQETQDKRF